jgi:hypothetical protein
MVEPSWNIHQTYPTSSNLRIGGTTSWLPGFSEYLGGPQEQGLWVVDSPKDIGDSQNTLGDGLVNNDNNG